MCQINRRLGGVDPGLRRGEVRRVGAVLQPLQLSLGVVQETTRFAEWGPLSGSTFAVTEMEPMAPTARSG